MPLKSEDPTASIQPTEVETNSLALNKRYKNCARIACPHYYERTKYMGPTVHKKQLHIPLFSQIIIGPIFHGAA